MKYYAVIITLAMVITSTVFFPGVINSTSVADSQEIKIALYDSISPSVRQLEKLFRYAWTANQTKYDMTVTRIGFTDVMNDKLEQYDVLVIGASGRQYFHGLIPEWKEKVKAFISNGGGYLGICGGANMASLGFENPKYPLDVIITIASLDIVDAYINDDQNEEWQYLWKEEGNANIPIKHIALNHTIFGEYNSRYITYGGGPGLYGMPKADSIAVYGEEPMNIAPIHFWRWRGSWQPYETIKTDIMGNDAAAAVTYGKGQVIIFAAHPEIPARFNGSVNEFFSYTIYGIPRFVYEWVEGRQQNLSYNWWIIRRSTAFVCDIPLPPIEELCLSLYRVSNYTIEAYTENVERVAFYLDGELSSIDDNPPFTLNIENNEVSLVAAVGHSSNGGEVWDSLIVEKH